MADPPQPTIFDPWMARLAEDEASIRPLRRILVKWSCLDGHEHETEEEASCCIKRRIASAAALANERRKGRNAKF